MCCDDSDGDGECDIDLRRSTNRSKVTLTHSRQEARGVLYDVTHRRIICKHADHTNEDLS